MLHCIHDGYWGHFWAQPSCVGTGGLRGCDRLCMLAGVPGVPFVDEEDVPFEVTNSERTWGAVAMTPIKASATR